MGTTVARNEKHNQESSSNGSLNFNRLNDLTDVCVISSTATLNAGFAGAPSTTFSVDSPELDRNRVQLRIGPSTDIDKDSTLRIGYEDELASSDQSHTASASFRMQW